MSCPIPQEALRRAALRSRTRDTSAVGKLVRRAGTAIDAASRPTHRSLTYGAQKGCPTPKRIHTVSALLPLVKFLSKRPYWFPAGADFFRGDFDYNGIRHLGFG